MKAALPPARAVSSAPSSLGRSASCTCCVLCPELSVPRHVADAQLSVLQNPAATPHLLRSIPEPSRLGVPSSQLWGWCSYFLPSTHPAGSHSGAGRCLRAWSRPVPLGLCSEPGLHSPVSPSSCLSLPRSSPHPQPRPSRPWFLSPHLGKPHGLQDNPELPGLAFKAPGPGPADPSGPQ